MMVRLKKEWLGNPKGKIMDLPTRVASELHKRGGCEKAPAKMVERSQNKMVESSENK